MSETLLLIAAGVGILLAGVGIGYWFASSRVQIRIAEAEEIKGKFDAYRRDVTEHFGRTAEHFQAIGKQYRELYEHLASGADSFCDVDSLDDKLAHEPATAIASPAADADAAEQERPRDYAEGEHADDDTDVEVAAEASPQASEPTESGDDEAPSSTDEAAVDEEQLRSAATEAGGNGKDAGDAALHAAEAADDDAADAVDDLKPEVKSDADEEKPQPTLH